MVAEHAVICPVVVGRAEPLAAARALLADARAGRGGALVLAGEAGVGKSRLVRAADDAARAAGMLVLQGACFEADRALPYAPLVDLVRTLAATTSNAVAAHCFAAAAPELVALAPELRSIFGDVDATAAAHDEHAWRRLVVAVDEALGALARTQPLLVVFEDLHWSDDATLDLALHLARRAPTRAMALLFTYRADEVTPSLERALATLDRARTAAELTLGRLDDAGVGAMLRAVFGDASGLNESFVAELHALTDGNPFFVEEVLKGLLVAGDLAARGDGRWFARPLAQARVPRTATEAVRRRLAGLSAAARDVASAAAVAGRRFDFALLQRVTRRDERELLALMKELLGAQLVVEESADRFAFRHALTREAIRGELLARERAALHRAVADALDTSGMSDAQANAHAGELAYHAFESHDWPRALDAGTRAAARAAALHAPREALAHVERALVACERLAVEPPAALLIARGRALETLSDFDGARQTFDALLDRARRDGDRAAEWEALHVLGMLWAARDYGEGGTLRHEALRVARALGEPARIARSLNRVGNWHINLEQPAVAIPYHEEALALLRDLRDDAGIAETVDLIAMTHFIAGDMTAASGAWTEAVARFTALGDRRGLSTALAVRAECGPSSHGAATAFDRALATPDAPMMTAATRLARDIGWRAGEAFALYVTGDVVAWTGEYDRAFAMLRESLAIAEELEHSQWQCGALHHLGVLMLHLLAPHSALPLLERAHTLAVQSGSRTWTRWTAAPYALALARTGHGARATACLDFAATAEGTAPVPARSVHADGLTLGERMLWHSRAQLALEAGDASAALAIADARLAAERREHDADESRVPALVLLRGEALAATGDADAERALATARDVAAALGLRPLLWRAHAALGHLHRRARRRLESRRAFDEAAAVVRALSALIPDDELRDAFGAGTSAIIPAAPTPGERKTAREALGGLTRREHEVAQLVAQARTNRAVAKSLGIGERTAEAHVAAALAKLGFTSRAQLAAWVARSRA